MPTFSFHRPRFLRFRRSRSRSPNPLPADDTAASPSPSVDRSRVLSSCPPSKLIPSEQDVDAAPSSSRQSVPGSPSHSQSSTGYLLVNTAPDDFGGQSSWASQSVTSIDVASSHTVCVSSPRGSVVQQDIHVALPSKLRDSIQVQQSLAPLPLSYRHATSSQQSFNLDPLIVSFSSGFQLRVKISMYS